MSNAIGNALKRDADRQRNARQRNTSLKEDYVICFLKVNF